MPQKRANPEKPYRFRNHKDRPISVEFDFIPGKRFSTGCYDMVSAVLFAEDFLRKGGMQPNEKVPLLTDIGKDLFTRRDGDSVYARDRLYKRIYQDRYYEAKQSRLDNYILPKFGGYTVTSITRAAIEAWLPTIRSMQDGRELSDNTKNKILIAFRNLMDEVKRLGYRDDNPAKEVSEISEENKEREPLPAYMIMELFPSSPEKRAEIWGSWMWAAYFSIFYDTGMRPGEVAALRVCDIYATPNGLAVATSATINSNEHKRVEKVKTTGKGYKERIGLLYDDTAELVLAYLEREGLHGEDQLFRAPNRKDGLIFPETANKHFKGVLRRMGFYREGFVQYCLRHTYETQRRGDMPDSVLAISMGHTHLRDDYDHQKAVDLIRRLDNARDDMFRYRERLGKDDSIVPIEKAYGLQMNRDEENTHGAIHGRRFAEKSS